MRHVSEEWRDLKPGVDFVAGIGESVPCVGEVLVESVGDVGGDVGDVVGDESDAVGDDGVVGEGGGDGECGFADGAGDGSEVAPNVLHHLLAATNPCRTVDA